MRWSDLGTPLTPGIYVIPQLGGKVEITQISIDEAETIGGDPEVHLQNWRSFATPQNFWTVRRLSRPESV